MKGKLLLFALLFSLTLVSAQFNIDLEDGSTQIIDWIKGLFSPFAEAILGGGELLFERFLLLLIVIALTYVVLSRMSFLEEKSGIIWTIALSVGILSTRYLTDLTYVQNALLPYNVLGITLTGVIPLLIYFFFVESFESSIARKTFWAFFIVVFIGLWIDRSSELGSLAWIYALTGLLSFLALLFDGTIRRTMIKQQMAQLGHSRQSEFERDIQRQIRDTERDLTTGIITPGQHAQIMKGLRKKLKAIRKN